MSIKKDLRLLLKPYYLVNIFLSLTYMVAKRFPLLCHYIFGHDNSEFDGVSKIENLRRYNYVVDKTFYLNRIFRLFMPCFYPIIYFLYLLLNHSILFPERV